MAEYETGYQPIGSFCDEEHEQAPGDNIIHIVPDSTKVRWNHIENLDEFFTRVYQYHQRGGFICMVVQDILQILQFAFVVLFSVFLIECVDYDVLFYEKTYNHTHKVTIPEAIYPLEQCVEGFSWIIIVSLLLASLFLAFRLIKFIYNFFQYLEIKAFYIQALRISTDDISNMTWHEVQRQLLEVQKEHQMCIHKQELTELDIYHRILRFKNYMISMVNKSLLPLKYRLPFVGDYVFMSTSLKYNLEMILFWGPWSPFENYWHLKPEYKNYHKRKDLAVGLSQKILWIGLANLLLAPIIFLWQILYSFFRYAEAIKQEPAFLGSRMWSLYARLYVRHFNELEHEFSARLNRGYKPSERYMAIFTSPLLVIVSKYTAFFAGSILAVFVILTIVDEDILAVEHVIGTMTVLTIIVTICKSSVPDEHMVWCPELLMRGILAQIHYMPDSWKGNAHTYRVRDEFAMFFQYKVVYLIEELLSPLVTPIILCLYVRHKSLEIVDFFRNFTVEVTGVGDVCSFAQMDIRRHGNAQWVPEGETEANEYQQAEDGKTELSLMHFTITNPEWKPPVADMAFINNLKEQATRDATLLSLRPLDNPLINSLNSLTGNTGYGYTSMMSSMAQQSVQNPANIPLASLPPPSLVPEMLFQTGSVPESPPMAMSSSGSYRSASGGQSSSVVTGLLAESPSGPAQINTSEEKVSESQPYVMRGGLRGAEGPRTRNQQGLLTSVHLAASMQQQPTSLGASFAPSAISAPQRPPVSANQYYNEETLEMLSAEMSFSALYMHELHQRRRNNQLFESLQDAHADAHARALWQVPDLPTPPPGDIAMSSLPRRLSPQREEEEYEEEINNTDASPGSEQAPLLMKPSPPGS